MTNPFAWSPGSEMRDEQLTLEQRVERLERALGGHFKTLTPGEDWMPGWAEAKELIEALDTSTKT